MHAGRRVLAVGAIVAGLAVAAAACGGESFPGRPDGAVGHEEAARRGFTDDVVAAALVVQDYRKERDTDDALVVLVRADGSTRVVDAPDVGQEGDVAMNARGDVAWGGNGGLHVLAGAGSTVGPRSSHGLGGTVAVDASGGFHWLDALGRPATPVGVVGRSAYSLWPGDATTGVAGSLVDVGLDGGRRRTLLDWRLPRLPDPTTESCGTSDPVGVGGAVWFLEEWCSADRRSLLLSRLVPASGRYASRLLRAYDTEGYRGPSTSATGGVAESASGGHLHDGRLFVVDRRGMIVAAALRGGGLVDVGRLSKTARTARSARVAWAGDRVAVLVADAGRPAVLETYDLDSGRRTGRVRVAGLAETVTGPDGTYVAQLAIR